MSDPDEHSADPAPSQPAAAASAVARLASDAAARTTMPAPLGGKFAQRLMLALALTGGSVAVLARYPAASPLLGAALLIGWVLLLWTLHSIGRAGPT
jgi:hypothetical protein